MTDNSLLIVIVILLATFILGFAYIIIYIRGKISAQERILKDLGIMGKATHTLVNSNMAAQLLLVKGVSRRLADITKSPADMHAADLADRMYANHEGKQAEVNTQPGTTEQKKGENVH